MPKDVITMLLLNALMFKALATVWMLWLDGTFFETFLHPECFQLKGVYGRFTSVVAEDSEWKIICILT